MPKINQFNNPAVSNLILYNTKSSNVGDSSLSINIKGISNSDICPHLSIQTDREKLASNEVMFFDKAISPSNIRKVTSYIKPKLVAIYGFVKVQEITAKFIDNLHKDYKYTTVAELNLRIGLGAQPTVVPEETDNCTYLKEINCFSKDITARKIDCRDMHPSTYYSEALLDKWITYLQENKSKTDVFSYINSKDINTNKKEALIEKLITKNIPSTIDTKSLNVFIKKYKLFDKGNINDAVLYLEKINKIGELSHNDIRGVYELTQRHFFRNSSKLGIDFFRENNIKILSSWNKSETEKPEKISVTDVIHKPYDNNVSRILNKVKICEPITYSEIRYMYKKYKNDTDSVIRFFLDKNSVEFAQGIAKGEWMKHDISAISG